MSEVDSLKILKQLVSCVTALHEAGIAHRDIKPENVLVNNKYQVKLIDFNISKSTLRGQSEKNTMEKFTSMFFTQVSSPLYAAPEIKEHCVYSESVDIWGLGIILFTLLFGSIDNYAENSNMSPSKKCSVLHRVVTDSNTTSKGTKELLLSLLNLEPNERPSATELSRCKCLA